MIRIAAILTAHNRKDKTLSCLKILFNQTGLPDTTQMEVFLVDDGSTDGTSSAIVEYFPQVNLLHGTGDLYWCGGMCIAFGKALEKGFDYYLWINDDTKIFPNALQILIETSCQIGSDGIVVGSTFDPITRVHTYGGVQRTNPWHPLKFSPVYPEDTPKQAETMNGNCVLIPARIAHSVGNLDSSFTHGIGDFDYGFRSSKLGFRVIVSSGYIGHCTRNTLKNTWQDPDLPLIERIKKVRSPLGLPPKEYAIFAYRYGGIFWFFYWILPYIRMIIPVLSRWYTKGKNE